MMTFHRNEMSNKQNNAMTHRQKYTHIDKVRIEMRRNEFYRAIDAAQIGHSFHCDVFDFSDCHCC